MKIRRFYAEAFKRIKVVEITPSGALVQVTGANGSGKSSVLDGIYAALAGKNAIDPQPVRRGEESALVELDLGKIRVTRKFKPDGETQLYVTAEDGAKYSSPQTMLDKLLGQLTFDPLEFSRMDAKGQSEALRKLVPLDVDADQVQRLNAEDFQARTVVGRQIKDLAPRVKEMRGAVPAEIPPRVDVAAVLRQMQEASSHNASIERQKRVQEQERQAVAEADRQLAAINAQIAELKRQRATVEASRLAAQELVDHHVTPPEPVDVGALGQQVEAANRANALADSASQKSARAEELEHELAKLEGQYVECTRRMDARKLTLTEALARAKMPIQGLSFGESMEVLYNGLPFQQASSAEQLRVSVAIAMAMNPTLRVLRIKDGSLLDDASLAMLAAMVEAADFQCWIEVVDSSGKVGVYMEDGAVGRVNEYDQMEEVEVAHHTPDHAT